MIRGYNLRAHARPLFGVRYNPNEMRSLPSILFRSPATVLTLDRNPVSGERRAKLLKWAGGKKAGRLTSSSMSIPRRVAAWKRFT